jgi:hypothetical protein
MARRETAEPRVEAGKRSDDRRGVCSIRRRRVERARPPQAPDRRRSKGISVTPHEMGAHDTGRTKLAPAVVAAAGGPAGGRWRRRALPRWRGPGWCPRRLLPRGRTPERPGVARLSGEVSWLGDRPTRRAFPPARAVAVAAFVPPHSCGAAQACCYLLPSSPALWQDRTTVSRRLYITVFGAVNGT